MIGAYILGNVSKIDGKNNSGRKGLMIILLVNYPQSSDAKWIKNLVL